MPWPTYLHELCGRDHDDLWSDVIERVRTHPHEAAVQGNFGQTALHVASYRYPPLGAVEAILAARPECTTLVNNSGETPLHLATDHSEEDVQLAILRCGPKAASMRDKYGDTPLHLACSSGDATSERFVDELLLACSDPRCRDLVHFAHLFSKNSVEFPSLNTGYHARGVTVYNWNSSVGT